MVPTSAHITRSLAGAFRLLMKDPTGIERFDVSIDGFWRSFSAAVIGLPIFVFLAVCEAAFMVALGEDPTLVRVQDPGVIGPEIFGYLLGWCLFPLVMIEIARLLNLSSRYVPYIIAVNWANLLGLVLFAVPWGLYIFGIFGPASASYASLALLAVMGFYYFNLAHLVLGAPTVAALLILAVDIGLMLAIDVVVKAAQQILL